ncbi:MAG: endonuclease/exonuclease/phosphatase family protein [Clostridiales bacterium]|nr:endonuclease/exonuclease/phosphatase family protein [Clostridiales bacterium]
MASAIRVISFNILFDDPCGAHPWAGRRDQVAALLARWQPDLLCVQEALEGQKADLLAALPPFDAYGVGRDDGKSGGEQAPIFHRRDRFDLLDQGHFWLSPTPQQAGSVGWDAKHPRTAVWKHLVHRASGRPVLVVNTHYDHVGREANRKSIDVIGRNLPPTPPDCAVLLCGDFNSDEQSPAYGAIVRAGFRDAAAACASAYDAGPRFSYHRFQMDRYGREAQAIMQTHDRAFRAIDHLFYRGNLAVARYRHLPDAADGAYPSDHFPVLCDLSWPRG